MNGANFNWDEALQPRNDQQLRGLVRSMVEHGLQNVWVRNSVIFLYFVNVCDLTVSFLTIIITILKTTFHLFHMYMAIIVLAYYICPDILLLCISLTIFIPIIETTFFVFFVYKAVTPLNFSIAMRLSFHYTFRGYIFISFANTCIGPHFFCAALEYPLHLIILPINGQNTRE